MTWLEHFLAAHTPRAVEEAVWRFTGTPVPLRIAFYEGVRNAPPRELVTSARAVVFSGADVLVLRNADGIVHALPGGRCEAGESYEDTVRREVLEETACHVTVMELVGLVHLRHLAPPPNDYPYLHPDFLWPIFGAETDAREARCAEGDYEVEACFDPVADALARVDLPSGIFIRAALARRSLSA